MKQEVIIDKMIFSCIFFLVIFLPTSSLSLFFNIHPAVFLIFVLIFLWFLVSAKEKRLIFNGSLVLPIIFFAIFLQSFFSLILAPDMPESAYKWGVSGFESPDLIRYYGLFTLLKSLLLALVIIVFVRGKDRLIKIIKLHIIASVVFSLFGIVNFFINCLFKISSFDFGVIAGRIRSVSFEPQSFASYLLTVVPFLIFGLVSDKNIFFKKKWIAAFLLIDLSALALTFSTGGYFSFLIVIILFHIFLLSKGFRQILNLKTVKIFNFFLISIMIIFLIFGQNVLAPMFGEKIFNEDGLLKLGGRVTPYRAGLEMIKDNPIFGVGPESFGYFFKEYSRESFGKITIGGPGAPAVILPIPQNLLIGVAANIGILGGVLYFLIFLYLCVKLFRKAQKAIKNTVNNQEDDHFCFICSTSLLLVLICLFVQNMAFWTPYAFFLWFFIGLAGGFLNCSEKVCY